MQRPRKKKAWFLEFRIEARALTLVEGVVTWVVVSCCAVASSRVDSTMVGITINYTVAQRTDKLGVEDLDTQALLYHRFVEERIDFVTCGGRGQCVEPLAGVGGTN